MPYPSPHGDTRIRWLHLFGIGLLAAVTLAYLFVRTEAFGLHGDEAYFGIQGIGFLREGLTSPFGMVKYTGALQGSLNRLSFALTEPSLRAMRIGGIVCNAVAYVLAVVLVARRFGLRSAVLFAALFAQSLLLLFYTKVAWEVCSFNFLFLTLLGWSVHGILSDNRRNVLAGALGFLLVSALGCYNHVIFASAPIAVCTGLAVRYLFLGRHESAGEATRVFNVSFLAALNSGAILVYMTQLLEGVWTMSPVLAALLPLALIAAEVLLLRRVGPGHSLLIGLLEVVRPYPWIKWLIPAAGILLFTIIHGVKFSQVWGNSILIKRVFSYRIDLVREALLLAIGAGLFLSVYIFLLRDLRRKVSTTLPYVVAAYLLVFCALTQEFAIRHLLLVSVLLFAYLSVKFRRLPRRLRYFSYGAIVLNVILVQWLVWSPELATNRGREPITFRISHNKQETSAHFLDFTPVLEHARANAAGRVLTEDEFFIGLPFEFYRLCDPALQFGSDTVTVNYNTGQNPAATGSFNFSTE